MSQAEQGDPSVNLDFASKLQSAVQNRAAVASESAAPPQTEEAQTSDQETASQVEAEAGRAEEAGSPAPEAELRSKQLAALARKERELREREEAFKAREAAFQTPEQPEQAEASDGLDISQIKDNLDLQAVAIYRELGNDSGKEILDRITALKYEQRLNRIEQQSRGNKPDEDAIRERVAQETAMAMKINEIHSVVDSGVPSDYSLLAAEAQDSPLEVKQAIAQHMDAVYEAEGRYCGVTEAMRAINDGLVAYAEKLDRYRGINKPQPAATTKRTEANTSLEAPLSDAELSSTPDRSSDDLEMDVDKRIAKARAKLGL